MAYVRVEQRNAHLASAVQMAFVNGRDGQVAKAVLTAISNTRRGSGENREDQPTAIQWTLWGKQAENAAEYLGRGSHINIVGRLQNNNYEKDGVPVYGMTFTAEDIDYLDSKAQADARRTREGDGADTVSQTQPQSQAAPTKRGSRKPARGRVTTAAPAADDVPF